jgi:hypothetical protein
VVIKAEHEASRQDTSPLTEPWSSIRDTEQVDLTQHITGLHHERLPGVAYHQVIAVKSMDESTELATL